MTFRIRPGAPEPLGLTLTQDGANIAVVSSADAIDLCLFDGSDREIARLRLPTRFGDVWCGFVEDLREGQRYGLRAHGAFAPERGLRFDARKLLVDPYALALDRPFALDQAMFSHGGRADADSASVMPKAIATRLDVAPRGPRARVPWRDAIIYELHVKGFTKRLEAAPEVDRGTFRGLAHPAAIAHLKELGVNIVELMPCAAWIDERHLPALGLTNYWGYNPIGLMAPDPRLAPGGWDDVRAAVDALRAAGIEAILDVVLNHSGESDELGPTISLRGLDNALYYRLRADDAARYDNDAGCGNVLALDRPAPMRLAMDALRAWATYAGLDGFRFDLAVTLARRADGFDPHAPLLSAIAQDPVLRDLRLIAEPWDLGPGGYRLGAFPAAWGEWNDKFRDTARKLWRGDGGLIGKLATRIAGSADVFARKRPSCSVNFITAHDGFTLADLVAYERKRNEANGEDNRDGTDDNASWNNGVEGPSDDAAVREARERDQRALLATLLLSRGTPMLAMGAEFGQSQGGVNNAYAQDNDISWLDWTNADADLFAFTRRLVALRKAHPALTRDVFLDGAPLDDTLAPDVAWLRPDGAAMRDEDWREARTLASALYAPEEQARPADRVLIAINPTRQSFTLAPPPARDAFGWRLALDSAEPRLEDRDISGAVEIAPRSVVLLAECGEARPRVRGVGPDLLDRLARAAGMAPDWSEISGERHIVSDESKRALLNAMRIPCANAAQARDSLVRLADELDRRATPLAVAMRVGEAATLRLPIEGAAPRALILSHEGGERREVEIDDARPARWRARDGRPVSGIEVRLPQLPAGRHKLRRDDAPDVACTLVVAPRAFLPARLREQRASGVSAQLYALRRDGDRGVGDFTTLAQWAERAGRADIATIGVNPLHALFPREPDRASPYHPSDRAFLDPIYIDVDRLGLDLAPLSDDAPLVDYPRVRRDKAVALARAHLAFAVRRRLAPQSDEARDFDGFVAQGGEALFRFACFETIAARRPERDWRDWPQALRRGDCDALGEIARNHAGALDAIFFQQWIADRQLAEAAARGRDAGLWLGLYRDLAVGAAPDGAEAWAKQDELLAGASIGAPPDPFSQAGQIWTLPPPDPLAMRRNGFASFRALLDANMRYAGALRIDHVMGLARLFVVPDGASGQDGAYLDAPLDGLLAELALESQRAQCLVVGEDLGTVPEGFRERLADADVLSYRVLWFERDESGFAPPSSYPRKSVACASTHDLPTLAGWWEALDIAEKEALGLRSSDAAKAERARRAQDRRAFLAALSAAGALSGDIDPDSPFDVRLVDAANAFVAATPSLLAITQLDDLAAERVAINLPGTDRERPNWRRRLAPAGQSSFAADRVASLCRTR